MNTSAIRARQLQTIGFAAFEAGRYREAEEAFRWAAVAAPEDVDGWVGLGSALAKQGRHEEAVIVFAMGSMAAPADPWPVLLAAEAYLASGEARKASEALDWVEGLARNGRVDADQEAAIRRLRTQVAGRVS